VNTIERLAAQVALKADRVTMPGETFASLIAVAKAADEAFKHNDIEDFGDNDRLVALEDALAKLKGVE